MFTHLYIVTALWCLNLFLENKSTILLLKNETPIYENKSYKRRAVEDKGFPRKSYQVETKDGRGPMFNYHSTVVVEIIYNRNNISTVFVAMTTLISNEDSMNDYNVCHSCCALTHQQ